MSDDLVKRLHWHHNFIGTNPWSDGYPFLKEVRDRLGEAADRIEALTAERDRAYANGYSDAETEISKSALGQRNDFLHAQYANAADHIKVLTAKLADAMVGLEKCQAELDEYSHQEYPLDHPVHERYRQRDHDANPARVTLAALKGEKL